MGQGLREPVRRVLRAARLEDRARELRRRARARSAIEHRGHLIPPPDLRLGGHELRDDDTFLASAIADAKRLEQELGLTRDSRILDLGCGPGRLAIGLLADLGTVRQYAGIDVDKAYVAWSRRHIERHHPDFEFRHIDVANARYHPRGQPVTDGFQLPFADASFDVICLISVFSHMEAKEVAAYLRQLNRVLAPDGGIFLTAFLEDGVEDVTVNPPGYRTRWIGELHCVRFNREFFDRLVEDAGLRIVRFGYSTEPNGQSAVQLRSSRSPDAASAHEAGTIPPLPQR
jgi:SAM-dependent methyltransferase